MALLEQDVDVDDTARSRADRHYSVVDLVLLAVLAAGVMLYRLGDPPTSGDEATSYFIATRSWDDFWTTISRGEANASLFYLLLRIPVAFGSSPAVIRLIPAIAGILAVPVLYVLLARLFGRWTAVVGAASLALSTFFLEHVQFARGYSMSALLAIVATLLFVLCVEKPTRTRLILYVLAAVAGAHSHFFCALVMVAHFLSLFLLPPAAVPWRRLIVSYVAMAALSTPLAYFMIANDRGQVNWVAETTPQVAFSNLYQLASYKGPWLGAAIGVGLLLAVVRVGSAIARRGRSRETWAGGLIVMWCVVPLLLVGVITVFKPLFVARFMLAFLPGLLGAVVFGFAILRSRAAFAAASVLLLVLSALRLPAWYSKTPPDWRHRADWVIENAGPDDVTLFYSPTAIRHFGYHAGYYREREDGRVAPPPIYPPLDWLGYSQTRFNPDLGAILTDAAQHDGVFLITAYHGPEERVVERAAILRALQRNCSFVDGFRGVVRLFEDCSPP